MITRCILLDVETTTLSAAILDKRNPEFANPIFHKIACISYAILDDSFKLEKFETLGLNSHTEREVIEKIVSLFDKDTMVVTWSGRRFDLPVILYRAMFYGIPCQFFFKNEFDKRYTATGHFDLQDNMMFFGASEKLSLDHAATVMGLPGKMEVSGGAVEELWARNRFLTIGTYCVTDVVQLLVLFLRWSFLRGLASASEVNESLDSVATYSDNHYVVGEISSQTVRDGIQQVVSNCDWKSLKVR